MNKIITKNDFQEGQDAFLLMESKSYHSDNNCENAYDSTTYYGKQSTLVTVIVTKISKKYVTITNEMAKCKSKFENANMPYLKFSSGDLIINRWCYNTSEYKLFSSKKDAEEFIERQNITERILKSIFVMNNSGKLIHMDTLHLISSLLMQENNSGISGMFTVNSMHIKESTQRYLNDIVNKKVEGDLKVYAKPGSGWFIEIPEDEDWTIKGTYKHHDDIDPSIPEDLVRVMGVAATLGCTYLCLDENGIFTDEKLDPNGIAWNEPFGLPIYD